MAVVDKIAEAATVLSGSAIQFATHVQKSWVKELYGSCVLVNTSTWCCHSCSACCAVQETGLGCSLSYIQLPVVYIVQQTPGLHPTSGPAETMLWWQTIIVQDHHR